MASSRARQPLLASGVNIRTTAIGATAVWERWATVWGQQGSQKRGVGRQPAVEQWWGGCGGGGCQNLCARNRGQASWSSVSWPGAVLSQAKNACSREGEAHLRGVG